MKYVVEVWSIKKSFPVSLCSKFPKICSSKQANLFKLLKFWGQKIFSLRRGDLIGRSCLSVGLSVCLSGLFFLIFQKRCFEIINLNLSNSTKLIVFDSLLHDIKATEIQIATCLIRPRLYWLIHFSKSLSRGKSK